ncbi:unnamed protein product [Ceutorhynchus assimilis]|uniref:Xyloside xylosyltransferase 1 n=1 Tax=Ceutorhynchus assimilis TaxID=467358 RepID=A0A9N9QPP1_9CUCU|nr:unnamed protein product [Ceutorhynchus assimilis]
MKKPKKSFLLHAFLFIILICLVYFAFITINLKNNPPPTPSSAVFHSFTTNASTITKNPDYNIWLIFTKVSTKSPLTVKFENLLYNLLNVSSVLLNFNIIVDEKSKSIALLKLTEIMVKANKSMNYKFYDVQDCARKITDIYDAMMPFFSSKPGTYYSDALFYISLGLYRVAPIKQKRAILLDCDLYFKKDVALLFEEFQWFKSTAFFGLAPELTPVYKHILHMYKRKHKTTFGEFYHQRPLSPSSPNHPKGFQGYNSGVVLVDFEKQRNSTEFSKIITKESVINMTEKYKFRGHLGDQDFYTLLGYEYPELIQTLNCGFNRQLCTWWRDHGYREIFDYYFKCDHPIVVLHGNCNTRIPMDYVNPQKNLTL